MTEQEPQAPIDRTQRAIDEVFEGHDPKAPIGDNRFDGLGTLAGLIILNREFDDALTLWRDLQGRVVRGGYSTEDTARLQGIVDVVGGVMRYKPSEISVDEYMELGLASRRDVFEEEPNDELRRLNMRGIVALRRLGKYYTVELTPRGEQAKELFEAKPSV